MVREMIHKRGSQYVACLVQLLILFGIDAFNVKLGVVYRELLVRHCHFVRQL